MRARSTRARIAAAAAARSGSTGTVSARVKASWLSHAAIDWSSASA
jgi:hypothetical protein